MSTSHTRGPWVVVEHYSPEDAGMMPSAFVAAPNGEHVAVAGYVVEIPETERQANARLIAAAPDLLAALEFVMRRVPFIQVEAHAIGKAAIAKARGIDTVATTLTNRGS